MEDEDDAFLYGADEPKAANQKVSESSTSLPVSSVAEESHPKPEEEEEKEEEEEEEEDSDSVGWANTF